MNQNKMYLVNNIFNNETIRTVWDKDKEKYYISVVDIVSVVSESKDGRNYWNKLKQRLKNEGNETVTNCHQLKLKAIDGKYRVTDVVDIEGMFRIIESIPSKNAEPIKQWLAKLGRERIDETFDPSLSMQRSIDIYRAKGYDEKWIAKRIKGIQDRKKLTDIWKAGGIENDKELYLKYADGRDEGLSEIDENSSVEFNKWYNDDNRFGGHPWEIIRGHSFARVNLQVCRDNKGYYLSIDGSGILRKF